MEAVPRVPMLHFNLKQTQQKTSFSRLKQYIAECYQEDPESFSKEIQELESLRSAAYFASIDEAGYNVIKRYYCQLHSLQSRFPLDSDPNVTTFTWRDVYSSNTTQSTDLRHEMAVVLYNYGALHTQLAASAARETEDEMKLACTHFQRAAWAFETVRDKYGLAAAGDMYPELLLFMQNICFAQAQECILEKSLIDSRKAIIVAKVTSQIIEYYNSAFAALLSGGEEGLIAEIVGSKIFREWRQYIQFKVQYMSCILLLYQGQHAEEQQKMGERVTLYQAAFSRLEEANKEAKHLTNQTQIVDALAFVMDVVEAKRKAAKNENEFIYHEEVPELCTISTIAGANLVKGIALNVADASVAAEDIFRRLIPIKAHEHSSLYSEEKANLLRRITQKIDSKDSELNKFMESLSIDSLSYDAGNVSLPEPLIARCADLNARPNAIPELISKMASLAEICVDVENTLHAIHELLSDEESYEKDYQQTMGYRPGGHFIELKREFMKYQEAHSKAGDSNETLRTAMEQHVNNLKILSKSMDELQAAIPTCTVEIDPKLLSDTQMLLNKVNEMRVQRGQLYATLNDNVQKDDITAQLIVCGEHEVETLMKTEMAKHEQLVNIIEQNLVAQGNILKSFTDAYAKCMPFTKAVFGTKHKREIFISSLINSYDVYDDLLGKSLKGLEFYKKLQNNIHKLAARVRSARDVQDEERQQRIESMNKKAQVPATNLPPVSVSHVPQTTPSMPMHYSVPEYSAPAAPVAPLNPSESEIYDQYHSTAIRPTPIGQENTAVQPNCVTSLPYDYSHAAAAALANPSEIPMNYASPSPNTYNTPRLATSTPHSMTHPTSTPSSQQYYNNSQASNPYLNTAGANAIPTSPNYSSTASPSIAMSRYGNDRHTPTSHAPHSNETPWVYGNANLCTANTNNATTMTPQPPYSSYSMPSAAHVSQPQNFADHSSNVDTSRMNAYLNSPYMQASSTPMYYPTSSTSNSVNMLHPSQLPVASLPHQVSHSSQSLQTPQAGQPLQQMSSQSAQHHQIVPSYSQAMQVQSRVPSVSQSHASNAYTDGRHSTPLNMHQPASIGQYSVQNQMYSNASALYSQPTSMGNVTPHAQYPTQPATPQQSMNAYAPTATPTSYPKADANPPSYYNVAPNTGPSQMSTNLYYNSSTAPAYNQYNVTDFNAHGYSTDAASIPYDHNYMMPMAQDSSTYASAYSQPANVPNVYPPAAMSGQAQSATYTSAQVQSVTPTAGQAAPAATTASHTIPKPVAKLPQKPNTVKFDLLSELDNVPIPAPTLQPIKFDLKPEVIAPKVNEPPALVPSNIEDVPLKVPEPVSIDKSDSIEEALAQLSVDEELTAKTLPGIVAATDPKGDATAAKNPLVPPSTADIENFYKEVQRYEKVINSLTTKTLNGSTPLETKWKELQDTLKKDSAKRTVVISKLFPEKNRNMLAVPYDHARVLLPTETDNYINAAHIQDIGPQLRHFILADAPTFNTVKDFWRMTWSQNSTYIVYSTAVDESAIPLFPKQMHREQTFGDYTVSVLIEHHHLYVIERRIRLTSNELNQSREVIFIQPKQWPAKNPIANIIRVSQNAIDILNTEKNDANTGPIILSCMTNMERSCYVLLSITSILALESSVIINANDIWYSICSQRHNILNDMSILQQSMQIILQCCREFIKKKSPKSLATNIQTNYYFIEEEETPVKDPFKDLDPLWKLK